ncbi:uncharacterized protein FN964_002966 isoform 2-T2 [Alca torda]
MRPERGGGAAGCAGEPERRGPSWCEAAGHRKGLLSTTQEPPSKSWSCSLKSGLVRRELWWLPCVAFGSWRYQQRREASTPGRAAAPIISSVGKICPKKFENPMDQGKVGGRRSFCVSFSSTAAAGEELKISRFAIWSLKSRCCSPSLVMPYNLS